MINGERVSRAVAHGRRDLVLVAGGVICRNCSQTYDYLNGETLADIRSSIRDGELDDHTCIYEAVRAAMVAS